MNNPWTSDPHFRPIRSSEENSMYSKYRVGLLAVLVSAAMLQAQKQLTAPPTGMPPVAATVNGQPISEVAVQRALRAVPPEKHADARGEILNFLIDNALIEQHLAPQVQVPNQDVDGRIQDLRTQLTKQ